MVLRESKRKDVLPPSKQRASLCLLRCWNIDKSDQKLLNFGYSLLLIASVCLNPLYCSTSNYSPLGNYCDSINSSFAIMWHPVEQLSPTGKERESHDRKALEDLFSQILTCQQDVFVFFF